MKNTYCILRHGEALSNVKNVISCWPEKGSFPLTEKGRKEVKKSAEKLKNIDLIFSSDLLRTKQTAEIAAKALNVEVKYDKRLREYNVGIFNGRPGAETREFFRGKSKFKEAPPGGETYVEIEERTIDFLSKLEEKYSGKNILIISHQMNLSLLEARVKGVSNEDFYKEFPMEKRIKTGEVRKLI